MTTGDYFRINIDTNGDREREREIWIPWMCGAVKVMDYIDDDARVYCRVPHPKLDTGAHSFLVLVPVRCLGSPALVRCAAGVLSDHVRAGLRRIPEDGTAWTPLAAVGESSSVADPVDDTTRAAG